jgi:glycerol-3-phosphate dehydrogenase
MPICTEAYRILYEGKPPMEAMRDLMGRARRNEDSGAETWVG